MTIHTFVFNTLIISSFSSNISRIVSSICLFACCSNSTVYRYEIQTFNINKPDDFQLAITGSVINNSFMLDTKRQTPQGKANKWNGEVFGIYVASTYLFQFCYPSQLLVLSWCKCVLKDIDVSFKIKLQNAFQKQGTY